MPLYPPKPTRAWANTDLHRKLIGDSNWIVEPKKNGDRCLIQVGPDGPELWNRHGKKTRYTWLKDLKEELESWDLPPGIVLDCELCHEPKPNQDLWVFDVPTAGGDLHYRRNILVSLFEEMEFSPQYIHLVPWMDKTNAYDEAIDTGEEGVVFKRLDSLYQWQAGPQSAEVPYWIKMKPAQEYK